ncbi:hypothetical protein NEOKW01_1509 [Nematocida sp. AWRm80]|nr:hypothetical protein NEOKW01_1509 [Nematocida sp. AWRm80]
MRYKKYIYIVITLIGIKLYKQSNNIDRTGIDTKLEEGVLPADKNNIYRSYYSVLYNNIPRKKVKIDQSIDVLQNTDNNVNTALDIYIPYSAQIAKQSDASIAIANSNADSDDSSDNDSSIGNGTDDLLSIENIKRCINIEEKYIVINMYMLYRIRNKNFSILRKKLEKYNGYKIYIQYNNIGTYKRYTSERTNKVNELLDQFSTVVIWVGKKFQDRILQRKSIKKQLNCFNGIHIDIQQFIKRTDIYMENEEDKDRKYNKSKKRIVLYNMYAHYICGLVSLIKYRNVISIYVTKSSSRVYNFKNLVNQTQKIHALDIVTARQAFNKILITFGRVCRYKDMQKDAVVEEDSVINLNSINSNESTNTHTNTDKDKMSPQATITYLALIDRVHNMDGIGSIYYIANKTTDRLDLCYSMWVQLSKSIRLSSMSVHTLVIYTIISKEKKEAIKQAEQRMQNQCNKIAMTKAKNSKIKKRLIRKWPRKNVSSTSKRGQSDTNKSDCLGSGPKYIKDIITKYKTRAHTKFPNLKTLIIYAFKSDYKVIEANIEEWLNSDKQANNKKPPQAIEKQENNSQNSSQKIKAPLKIEIYFVSNDIKVDSAELFTPAYRYDDKNKPNLEFLRYNRNKNGVFIKSTQEEASIEASLAAISKEIVITKVV